MKLYPGLKAFHEHLARQFPTLKILPYSQPPSLTFYDAEGDQIDRHEITKDDSANDIVELMRTYGMREAAS